MQRRKLCIARAAFWLVLTISFSTAAQQASETENAEPQRPAGTALSEQQAPEAGGQQPATNSPPQAESKPGEPEKKPEEQQGKSGASKGRMFGVMPNFLTVENAGQVPPLTVGQKFKVVARGTFDPFQFFSYGFIAGIGQATNSENGYGQGAQGYGKRYGAIFGDTTIASFIGGAVLPSLLRQDPRYFREGKGGFGHRAWHAVRRVFVIRGDSGREQFNASEIFGSALSAGIATYSYHPQDDRKLGNVMGVWGTQLGLSAVDFMMKEFWPDLRRHLRKKKDTPAAGNEK